MSHIHFSLPTCFGKGLAEFSLKKFCSNSYVYLPEYAGLISAWPSEWMERAQRNSNHREILHPYGWRCYTTESKGSTNPWGLFTNNKTESNKIYVILSLNVRRETSPTDLSLLSGYAWRETWRPLPENYKWTSSQGRFTRQIWTEMGPGFQGQVFQWRLLIHWLCKITPGVGPK